MMRMLPFVLLCLAGIVHCRRIATIRRDSFNRQFTDFLLLSMNSAPLSQIPFPGVVTSPSRLPHRKARMTTTYDGPSILSRKAKLSNGLSMEWLSCAKGASASPPLLFVHGTFHGAWCWSEHWMTHFAEAGFDCHAISLRGTSGTPEVDGEKSIKINQHVADLQAFVNEALNGEPPILVGHSFGGASCLKYLEAGGQARGIVLLCSVPPSGNGPMVMRFLWRSLGQAFLITKGFALKTATKSVSDARALFFDERTEDSQIAAFLSKFQADSMIGLDLSDFNRNLPSRQTDSIGRASWLSDAMPALVIGCENDAVVDREGVEETATFLNVEAEILPGMPHDLMLCQDWEKNADRVISWLQSMRKK